MQQLIKKFIISSINFKTTQKLIGWPDLSTVVLCPSGVLGSPVRENANG